MWVRLNGRSPVHLMGSMGTRTRLCPTLPPPSPLQGSRIQTGIAKEGRKLFPLTQLSRDEPALPCPLCTRPKKR